MTRIMFSLRSPSRLAVLFSLLVMPTAGADDRQVNLALGKSYTMQPAPSYSACLDPEDASQLTDGKKIVWRKDGKGEQRRHPWVRTPMVGWSKPRELVSITLDLQRDEPISGVSFHTAAGGGGNTWPGQIAVFVGVDGRNWHFVGDLRSLSDQGRPAPSDGGGYGGTVQHAFEARELQTHGRYVRLVMAGSNCVFSDEIEVYSGDPAWTQIPLQGAIFKGDDAVREFVMQHRTRAGYEIRLLSDRRSLEAEVAASSLPEEEKKRLHAEVEQGYRDAMARKLPEDASFRAVIPFNDAHARMHAVRGRLWQEKLGEATVISRYPRYAWLEFGQEPQRSEKNRIAIKMLRHEFRSDLLLLANPSQTARQVRIELEGMSGKPDWLRVYSVPWTDTLERRPVATALSKLPWSEGVATLALPAGITTKLWLTVDSSKLPPGTHRGSLILSDAGGRQTVAFEVQVSGIMMPKPPMSLGLWDFAHPFAPVSPGFYYGVTAENLSQSVRLMKEYHVNTAWAGTRIFPPLTADHFDSQNQLKAPLDTSAMEQWMTQVWPDADRYIYQTGFHRRSKEKPAFAGVEAGSPDFEPRIAAWLKAITSRMEAIGVDPRKLTIIPFDEAQSGEFEVMTAWANALEKADPRVGIFMNPAPPSSAEDKGYEAVIGPADIISQTRLSYLRNKAVARKFYADAIAKGKELQFYACSGPVRTADPTWYFRLMSWFAFSKGATGISFWAFGDNGKAASSWNEYTSGRLSYSPVYLSRDSVVPTIHLEAIREGIQDTALLAMLKEAVEKNPSGVHAAQARKILKAAVGILNDNSADDDDDQFTRGMWFQATGPSERPDRIRLEALKCLENLREEI